MNNPAMRFKRDDGTVFPDWNSSEIGNVADTCSGGTPSTSVSEYWDGPIQWLTPTEINSKYVHNSKRTITSAGIANSSAKLLPIGALLLTTRATIGACSINNFDGDVSTNQGFQSLICKSSLFNEYAYYAITRDKFQKELIKHSSGSTFLEISPKNLKKLPIPIPCLEEQQKIASFFSTLDQKIELNERKIEALEKLKKGVMQKIFNRKIRFKKDDGTDFPDWKVSELGNIAEIRGGGTPSTSNSDYWDGNIQWLTPTEIDSKYVHESNRKITESGLANSSAKLLPMGTILLTTRATLGACSINNFNGFVCTNQGFQSLVCKPIVLNEYVYYAITFDEFQKKITKHASGSTFLEISAKNLKKLTIPTPSLEEQRKIADLLSTLDLQIDIKKKTVSAMRDLKRGFMQQMFI